MGQPAAHALAIKVVYDDIRRDFFPARVKDLAEQVHLVRPECLFIQIIAHRLTSHG